MCLHVCVCIWKLMWHWKQNHGGGGGGGSNVSSNGPWGINVSAGELLGRTHEELVLLLIQLRRQSAGVCKAMETCHVEIEAQVCFFNRLWVGSTYGGGYCHLHLLDCFVIMFQQTHNHLCFTHFSNICFILVLSFEWWYRF